MRTATERRNSSLVFDLLVQPLIDPVQSLAIDEAWMRAVVDAQARPLLRVYAFAGDVLSLGRFHAVPASIQPGPTPLVHRRHSGGRCILFGQGLIGVSIILPHRSALVADEPYRLNPSQVLNRCVRGILSGLKSVGIPAFYPGRDCITADGRIVAMTSFTTASDGGLIFEAVLAVTRDFAATQTAVCSLPVELAGKIPRLQANEVTSLGRELGVELTVPEVAEILARGYARQFEIEFVEQPAPLAQLNRQIDHLAKTTFAPTSWLGSRVIRPELDHHGVTEALLGSLDAYFSLMPNGTLRDVVLSGDIIANAAAVEEVEAVLRGCRAERTAIDAAVDEIFAGQENFVLGLTRTSSIGATVCAGL